MEHLPEPQQENIETELVPEQGELPPGAKEFSSLLADITADRASVIPHAHGQQGAEFALADVPEDMQQIALENARLLHRLNGHRGSMLRKTMRLGASEGAQHLRQLYDWSARTTAGEGFGHEGLLAQPPAMITAGDTPEGIYESLQFAEHHPDTPSEMMEETVIGEVREILGLPEGKSKWIDLVPSLFNAKDTTAILGQIFERVGYLPEDLTSRKAFQKVPASSLIKVVDALRTLEHGNFGEHARYERSRLLNAMIAEGNLAALKEGGGTITLDSNGLFINAGALHAHLPFGLIEDDAFTALERDGWLSAEGIVEAKIRALGENNAVSEIEEVKQYQLDRFLESIKDTRDEEDVTRKLATLRDLAQSNALTETEQQEIRRLEATLAWIKESQSMNGVITEMIKNPQYFVKKTIRGEHIIPDLLIDELRMRGADGASVLAEIGEAISEELAKSNSEKHADDDAGPNDFASHQLLRAHEREYERRSSIINNPRYYNAHKMLRGILEANVETSIEDEFIVLRGDYKRVKNGDQHSFVEVLNKGKIARVLVNENKQLNAPLRKAFERLPHYERDQYEDLERAVTAYKHFAQDLERLRRTKSLSITAYEDYEFWRAAKDALGFLSGHASPEHFRTASELFDKVEAAVHDESYTTMHECAERFLALVEKCDQEYRTFLYASIGRPVNFTEAFMPEITKSDVAFGERFAEEAREKCVKGGYDEKLSAGEANVRVVSLDYKESDPTAAIPFHVEADALNALRISPRKFLNIAGGARLMEPRDQEAMDAMIRDILGVAHEHQLNVAVPGTQIGIGKLFGAANMEYRAQYGHLPLAKQARLFAISPGGNTYYPGNPYLTPEFASQTYAMSPVDTIVTPFSVDWDAKGLSKRDSLYLNHVAYMEALYDRASNRDQRAMLLLNGGLYTLIEATEAYRRGFPLILAEDSGRLAQVLAEYVHTQKGGGPTSDTSPDEMYRMVMSAVEKLPPGIAEEFTEKDFGKAAQAENEDYLVYREYLYRMLKVIEYNRWSEGKSGTSQITTMKRADVAEHLRGFYAQEFKGNKRGPTPIPAIKKWEDPYFER